MAGCSFTSTDYVGTQCTGYIVVVNGSYVACVRGQNDGGGGCQDCNPIPVPIFNNRCAAENTWNKLEGCAGGSCATASNGSGCTTSTGAYGCCQNGVCVTTSIGPAGCTGCASGDLCILGQCVPQLVAYGGGVALALLLLSRRKR